MSGGSFDYLGSCMDMEDVQRKGYELGPMADFLATVSDAEDAAAATHAIALELRRCQVRIDAMVKKVGPVWHAAEWWQSGDWSEAQFRRALAEYRGETEQKEAANR